MRLRQVSQMKTMRIKIGAIAGLILVIAITFSFLLGIAGCAGEIAEPEPEPTPEPAPELSPSYVVVDTGQGKCYDNLEEIACPLASQAFYGQDAQYQGNQPHYQDNRDGTVTDLNTGLMWQETPGDKVTYDEALAGAKDFGLAGYHDWRVPAIKELYSLILFSGTDPAPESVDPAVPFIDTNYFDFEYGDISAGERIIDAQYWSCTEYVGTTMSGAATVFGVNFADGRIKGYPRSTGPRGQPMTEFVRYVRGDLNYGVNNFMDNGDGTITDNATGLMWSKDDSGGGMNWKDALSWVQTRNAANYLGYNDWRLPNAKELQSIVDYNRCPDVTGSAAISPLFTCTKITNEAGQADYAFYWTGTTHVRSGGMGDAAVYISFGRAMGYMNGQWQDVHGAGAQRSDPKSGDPASFPTGRGPQGDAVRLNNFVRLVREAR
jgi:hypothetical protein